MSRSNSFFAVDVRPGTRTSTMADEDVHHARKTREPQLKYPRFLAAGTNKTRANRICFYWRRLVRAMARRKTAGIMEPSATLRGLKLVENRVLGWPFEKMRITRPPAECWRNLRRAKVLWRISDIPIGVARLKVFENINFS